MSYVSHPTMIILQFMLQTGLVVTMAIFFIPVIHDILFDSNAAGNIQTPFLRELIDNLWVWAIIFFIAGMAGNVIWFIRALQAQQAQVRTF